VVPSAAIVELEQKMGELVAAYLVMLAWIDAVSILLPVVTGRIKQTQSVAQLETTTQLRRTSEDRGRIGVEAAVSRAVHGLAGSMRDAGVKRRLSVVLLVAAGARIVGCAPAATTA
jgi:hypothetical protein